MSEEEFIFGEIDHADKLHVAISMVNKYILFRYCRINELTLEISNSIIKLNKQLKILNVTSLNNMNNLNHYNYEQNVLNLQISQINADIVIYSRMLDMINIEYTRCVITYINIRTTIILYMCIVILIYVVN